MANTMWSSSAFESFLDPDFFESDGAAASGHFLMGERSLPKSSSALQYQPFSAPSPSYSQSSLDSDNSTSYTSSSSGTPYSCTSPSGSPTVSLFPITTLPFSSSSISATSPLFDVSSPQLVPVSIPTSQGTPTSTVLGAYCLPTSPKAMSRPSLAPHEHLQAIDLASFVSRGIGAAAEALIKPYEGGKASPLATKASKKGRAVASGLRIATTSKAAAEKQQNASKTGKTDGVRANVVVVDRKQERLIWLNKLQQAELEAQTRLQPRPTSSQFGVVSSPRSLNGPAPLTVSAFGRS